MALGRRTAPRTGAPEDRVAVVSASGDVDRAGLEACDYLLSQAGPGTRAAVVDLSAATHLDYRATVILVARRRVLRARGGDLAVAAGRRDVRDIVRASAGAELPVFTTVEEALSYVKGEGDVVTAAAPGRQRQMR